MENLPAITVGAVKLEQSDNEVLIRSVKLPDLVVSIPLRTLEAWCLRKLREDALMPAGRQE